MKSLSWLALVVVLVVACQNPASNLRSAPASPHSLTLSWGTGTGSARTLLPASFPTAATYDVVLHPTSGASSDVSQTGLGVTSWTFNNLAAVSYAITVTGRDSGGIVILQGTGTADMAAAAVQNPVITLYYNATVGTGQIHLTFDCTGSTVTTTSVTLVNPSGATIVSNAALAGSSPTFTYTNTSAPVGTYKLFTKFSTGTTYAFKLESVLVFQNVDTVATVTVAPGDFGPNYVPVTSLSLSTPTAMYDSQTQTLTATLNAGASNPFLTWSSNAPNVATVNQAGIVTGVAAGTAIITARSIDNTTVSATASVVVSVAPKDLTTFSFAGYPYSGYFNGTNISIAVPTGTSLTALVANFTTTGTAVKVGATTQSSGSTSNDFTNPVTYSVVGVDSSTKNFTVTVSLETLPASEPTVLPTTNFGITQLYAYPGFGSTAYTIYNNRPNCYSLNGNVNLDLAGLVPASGSSHQPATGAVGQAAVYAGPNTFSFTTPVPSQEWTYLYLSSGYGTGAAGAVAGFQLQFDGATWLTIQSAISTGYLSPFCLFYSTTGTTGTAWTSWTNFYDGSSTGSGNIWAAEEILLKSIGGHTLTGAQFSAGVNYDTNGDGFWATSYPGFIVSTAAVQ